MAQCEAIGKTPGRPNFGKQCGRHAVTGSTRCTVHGGDTDTKTPEQMRQRANRTRTKCTATSRRTGEPCKAWAIHGATVCRKHGGDLPQVKKAARERFNDLIDPMINIAAGLVKDAEEGRMTHADQMRLVTFLADRTGFGTKAEVTVEVKRWETTLKGIIKTPPQALLDDSGINPREPFMRALEAPSASEDEDEDGPDHVDDHADVDEVIVATVEPEDHPQQGSAQPPRHMR